MLTLTLVLTVLTALLPSPGQPQTPPDPCASLNCRPDQFCFTGTTNLCLACNTACNGCTGPGPQECTQCATGHSLVNSECKECPNGQFGMDCGGTCHCLDDEVCDHVTGHCTGKCAKGYFVPPACQKECDDGFYGLDCLGECHCQADAICQKRSGTCPNDVCHPDWFGYACSKRLPRLSGRPKVTVVTCEYFTVVWSGWDKDKDFGDQGVPVIQYRLYSLVNGSDSTAWKLEETVAQDSNTTEYQRNVTGLQRDAYYSFRVDVHGSDDGKVIGQASQGLVSDPLVLVPCASTTSPPPVTVPIFVGADIFTSLKASNQLNDTLLVTWSIDPQFLHYSWNLTLTYQVIGIGDCESITDGNVTSVTVAQSDTEFRIQPVSAWSKYSVEMNAQGLGSISAANDTETIDVITAELAPSGNISQVSVLSRQSDQVTLTWTAVACAQRGGVLLRYDVTTRPHNNAAGGATQVLTTNVTTLVVKNLTPFTAYVGTIRYVNKEGVGPDSPEFLFTTGQGVPAAVPILSLTPSAMSVEVKVLAPVPVNGVLLDYYILYSDTATFTLPESLTFNVSSPGNPVVSRLTPDTTYYFKVRGRTAAGYGPYGATMYVRTLQARPYPPSALLQTARNLTCVSVAWLSPDQSAIAITGYTVTIINKSSSQGTTLSLSANLTSYSLCDLDPGSVYNLSITSRSGSGSGQASSILLVTEQRDPPAPPSPTLLEVNSSSATIEIEPVALSQGVVVSYQLHVHKVTSAGRKKRLAGIPGYVTAELSGQELQERRVFVIGDGRNYGGYTNVGLRPRQDYNVYYIVISTFYNLTKFNYSQMDTPIQTPMPPTTPQPTTSTTVEVSFPPSPEDDNGALIGVIVALLLLIIIIVLVIIFVLWWRRRRSQMLKSPLPYLELDEGRRPKTTEPKDDSEPEKYWNQITSLRESRYIVVGRECIPDDQLVPVSTQVAQPGTTKVTFKKEFRSLPKDFQQATTRQAEQYPDRNRFPHILPYDHSLVELAPDSSARCPYINANYMSGYKRQRCYIAAQSPYDEHTAVDFWRLIHQHKIKTVVLIANGVEDNIVKCTQFWPTEGKATMGRFYLELQEEAVYADFAVHEVTVRESREQFPRVVRLFDFTAWPEHGVPTDPIAFLDMRYKVRQYHGDERGPILVHCGTGVGRTGTFIAVDSLIDQYATEGKVSVFSFVRKMRKERPLMVRTCKQYEFIYHCLLEEFQAGDTMADATSIKTKYRDWTSKNAKTGRSFLRDQFQLLHRLTEGPTKDQCSTAYLPDNAKRNRYQDVVPSDLYRPELHTPAKFANTDYINAFFVDGYRKQKQFIITQTPLHTTLVDFWRLLYDHHVSTVVMMDNYNHEVNTCAQYWPDDVTMKQWEPFFVECTAAFQQENVTIRNLKVMNTLRPHEQPHMVRQFQFNAWAKNTFIPVSKTMVLDLLDLVIEYQASTEYPNSPIVVHCEDGATHSGLFVALALICERMEEEQEVDVYHVIKHVKRRRTQIIPDYEQLRFCYKTLWDYINLRMPGGTFTDTMGQTRGDSLYGAASLSLTSQQGTTTSSYY